MPQQTAGARVYAGTDALNGIESAVGRVRPSTAERPVGWWAFAGVAVASFGGPLALAALIAPGLLTDASDSAGLAMVAAAIVFTVPLAIWMRYSRHVHSSGGLYAFVNEAAGRQVALAQGAIWIFSYLLYVAYTTVQIVYDLLPAVLPGERQYQSLLALLIPIGLAGVMIAGRSVTLLAIGAIAGGQLVLAGILDGVTVAHISTPASSFGTGAPAGELAKASAQTSLLYICGSLPLFLGGEVARPVRTIRRGVTGAFALTAVIVVIAVAPLAAAPGLAHTDIPGMSVAAQFVGPGFAKAVGIGVAASTVGVMLCEYLALTRILHAITRRRIRPIAGAIGAVVVLAAPVSLIDPEGFYNTLLKPSLIALWLSQLIVFIVYPNFARKRGQRALPAWALSAGASAFALYGLWTVFQSAST
jgi:amino acid transporter